MVLVIGIIGIISIQLTSATTYETRYHTGKYVSYDGQSAALKITATVAMTSNSERITSSSADYVRNITNSSYAIVAATTPAKGESSTTSLTWAGAVSFKRLGITYSTQAVSSTYSI